MRIVTGMHDVLETFASHSTIRQITCEFVDRGYKLVIAVKTFLDIQKIAYTEVQDSRGMLQVLHLKFT